MTVQEQIRANRWRTILLLLLFAVLVGVLGVVLAYVFEPSLLIVVAIAGFLYAIFSWFASGSMVGTWSPARRRSRNATTRSSTVCSRTWPSPRASSKRLSCG